MMLRTRKSEKSTHHRLHLRKNTNMSLTTRKTTVNKITFSKLLLLQLNQKMNFSCRHGGWWKVKKFHEINGNVAIEFGTNSYAHSLDNGLFCVGPTRPFGEGPDQQQILTVIRISENKVAFKSGFGKYLAINKNGLVIGRSGRKQ